MNTEEKTLIERALVARRAGTFREWFGGLSPAEKERVAAEIDRTAARVAFGDNPDGLSPSELGQLQGELIMVGIEEGLQNGKQVGELIRQELEKHASPPLASETDSDAPPPQTG